LKSRERVIKALNHKEPDRVPIDLGAAAPTGISAMAYNRLKDYLGINAGKTKLIDMWQQVAMVEVEVRERFNVDTIGLWPAGEWKDSKLPDGSNCIIPQGWKSEILDDGSEVQIENGRQIAKRPAEGIYFDPIYTPLADATIEDLDDFVWPSPFSFYKMPDLDNLDMFVSGLEERGKFLYENSDLAVVGNFGGSIFEAAYGLRGFENFMIDLMDNKKFVEKLLDKLVKHNKEYFKRYNEAVGEFIQIIMVGGEDIGTQRNLVINPDTYRELIKPRQKELWQFINNNCDAKIMIHACGSIDKIIDDLHEAGIEVLNPVQTSANNMDPRNLKKKYGKKLSFWGGGCDTQKILPHGTPDEVKKEVEKNMKIFKPGGGFVFNQIHIIQYNVPPENIVAMFDTAYKHSHYNN